MFSYDQKGIKLLNSEFWLDAHRKVPFSFVSHGHSDHLRNHEKILATPATVRFHAIRSRQTEAIALNYGDMFEFEDMRIKLYPAGHILGSAMIWIERDGVTLLYTGDFKIKKSATAEPIEIPNADILIMESTFGNPNYTAEDTTENLIDRLDVMIRDCLKKGDTPIVLAYALGKAQEAMKILGDLGYAVRVHEAAWRFVPVYTDSGVTFNNCALWRGSPLARGEVLIYPPHLLRTRELATMRRIKTILLSGWANGDNGGMFPSDYAVPYSDHADFAELLQFVKQVNPKKVYTTHGFDDFPGHIRAIGYEAELLQPSSQYSLL